MAIEHDCSTCVFRDKSTHQCKRGDKAELYCMGGGFELWAGSQFIGDEGVLADTPDGIPAAPPQEGIDVVKAAKEQGILRNEAENEKVFDLPEQPYASAFSADIIQAMREIVGMDIPKLEANIGRSLSEDEKKIYEEIQGNARHYIGMLDNGKITEDQLREHFTAISSFSQALAQRPTSEAEGFNAVKKSDEVKSYSCEGCKHYSMVGCFLGRYYDCVDHGRYLFDAGVPEGTVDTSIERNEEVAEDKKDMDFIDSLLDERKQKEQ